MPNEQRHYSNELNLESVGINLPYNMQAEQSVLGAVLLKPETLTDLVEIIRPEMFYTRQNARSTLRCCACSQQIRPSTLSPCWMPSSPMACSPVRTRQRSTWPVWPRRCQYFQCEAYARSCRKSIWCAS